MAYMVNFEDQEKKKESEQNALASGETPYQVSSSQGGSEAVGSSGSSGNNSKQNTTQNQSGTWVNLNKYLDTNAGKATQYADTLVKPYTDTQEQYKSDLNTSKDNYTNDVKSDVAYNANASQTKQYADDSWKERQDNKIEGHNKEGNDWYNTVQGGYSSAGEYGKLDENDSYGDYGYGDLSKQAETYSNVTNKLGTEKGRIGLIDDLTRNQNRRVTAGNSALNNLVLQGSSEAQNKLQDHAIKFKELTDLLNTQTSDLNTMRQGVVDQAAINAQDAKDNKTNSYKEMKQYLEDEKARLDSEYDGTKNSLAKGGAGNVGSLVPMPYNLGLSKTQVSNLGLDPSKQWNKADYLGQLAALEDMLTNQIDGLGTGEKGGSSYTDPTSQNSANFKAGTFDQKAWDALVDQERAERKQIADVALKKVLDQTYQNYYGGDGIIYDADAWAKGKDVYDQRYKDSVASTKKLYNDYLNFNISESQYKDPMKNPYYLK